MLDKKEHAEKVLQREKAIKKEMADFARTLEITNNKSDYNRGYSDCRKKYEEKLRWIPVEEKLPEGKIFEPNQSRFRQSEDIELKLKSGRITIGYYDIPTNNFVYHD